jgi:hypothetical protein
MAQRQLHASDWKDISTDEAYRLSVAEFRGMVLQSLQDIRGDIKDIQQDTKIRSYITFATGGLAGIITSLITLLTIKH